MSTKVVYRQRYQESDEPVPGYRLTQFLGAGAMGEVWKASGPGGKTCALKIINLDQTGGRKEFRSLLRVKDINHPNLVPIHCIWLKDDQGNLLEDAAVDAGIMESQSGDNLAATTAPRSRETMTLAKADTDPSESRLKGTMAWSDSPKLSDSSVYKPAQLLIAMGLGTATLYTRLQDCQERGEKGVPEKELLRYLMQAAEGIDFLNENCQIIHCDIKPQNILIVGNAAQVCDFGLARKMQDARQTTAAFTPYYAPLEVIVDNQPGHSTDQYSLAITYVELKTGRPPYESETQGHIIKEKLSGRLDLRGLGPAEAEVIEKGAAIRADDRYPNCMEMVKALSDAVEADRQHSPWGAILKWAAVILVMAGIGGGGFWAWMNRDKLFPPIVQKPEDGDKLRAKPPEDPPVPPAELDQEFDRRLGAREYTAAARLLPQFEKGTPKRASRAVAEQELATPWWMSLKDNYHPSKGQQYIDELHQFLHTFHRANTTPLPEVTEAAQARPQWAAELTARTAGLDLSAPMTGDELKARLAWLDWLHEARKADPNLDPRDAEADKACQQLDHTTRVQRARWLAREEMPAEADRTEFGKLLAAYALDTSEWSPEEQARWRFCKLASDAREPAEERLMEVLPDLAKLAAGQKALDAYETTRLEELKKAWLAVIPERPDDATLALAQSIWDGSLLLNRRLTQLQALLADGKYPAAEQLYTTLVGEFPNEKASLLPYRVQLDLALDQPLPATFWTQFAQAMAQPATRDALMKLLLARAKTHPEIAAPAAAELTTVYTAADPAEKGRLKGSLAAVLKAQLDGEWKQPTLAPDALLKSLELYRELTTGDAAAAPSGRLAAWLVELHLAADPKAAATKAAEWRRTLAAARNAAKPPAGDAADAAYIDFVAARLDARDPTSLRMIADELVKLLEPPPAWLTKPRQEAAAEMLVDAALGVRLPQDDDLAGDANEMYQEKQCLPWLQLADTLGPPTWKSQLAWTLVRAGEPQLADAKLQLDAAQAVLGANRQADLTRLRVLKQIQLARGRAALARFAADRMPADLDLAVADHAAAIEGLFQFRSRMLEVADTAVYRRILSPVVPVLMKENVSDKAKPQAAHLLAIFGRLVDRSAEVRELVATETKVAGGRPEQRVAALRLAYQALERSTTWQKDVYALVARGKVLLQLPDNDPLAAGLQDTLEAISRDIESLPAAAEHPGALVFEALLAQRQALRTADPARKRELLGAALAKCDDAEKFVGGAKDELAARILEERSNIHLNRAFLSPPPTAADSDPAKVKEGTRGWHLARAAADASAAIEIQNREDGENAYNALGNALEDQAFYMRWNPEKSYLAALEAFNEGNTVALEAADSREALCLFNMGRCRVRYAEDRFVTVDRQSQFLIAAKNLADAIERWYAYDGRKAEAYYWLSRAYARLHLANHKGKVTMPGVEGEMDSGVAAMECANKAAELAKSSGQHEWAEFVLHQAELAQAEKKPADALKHAQEVLAAFKSGGLKMGSGGTVVVAPDQAYRAALRRIEASVGGPGKVQAIDEAKAYFAESDPALVLSRARLLVWRVAVALENSLWKVGDNRWQGSDTALEEARKLADRLTGREQRGVKLDIDVAEGRWQLYRLRDQSLAKAAQETAGLKAYELLSQSLLKYEEELDAAEHAELKRLETAAAAEIPGIRTAWSDYTEQRLLAHLAESRICRDALAGTVQQLVASRVAPNRRMEFLKRAVQGLQPLLALRPPQEIDARTHATNVKFLENVKTALGAPPPAP